MKSKVGERLPDIVMRGAVVGEETKAGRPARRLQHCLMEYCPDFGINAISWTKVAQDISEWCRLVEEGTNMYMTAWTKARHAKELFAVTASVPSVLIQAHRNVKS